jgi:hypothetical protein
LPASTKCPTSNKKAKPKRNGLASTATVEASIHKIIAVDPHGRQDRDLNVNERWTYLVDQWDKKIELKMARVEATKMDAHAIMFKAMNEVTQLTVAKRARDSKIFDHWLVDGSQMR